MDNQSHINLNNYEVFVIDFLDGGLSKEEEMALMAFLKIHPELKEEVDGLELATLEPLEISTDFKQSLKKTPVFEVHDMDENNYESYFIAFAEKDLNNTEIQQLERFLEANPSLVKEFDLHKKLFLQPDPKIKYLDKEGLRKRRILPVVWISSIAATLILLLAVSFFLQNNTSISSRQLANINTFNSIEEKNIVQQNSSLYALLPRGKTIAPSNFVAQVEIIPSSFKITGQESLLDSSQIEIHRLTPKPIHAKLFDVYDYHRIELNEITTPVKSFHYLLADASSEPLKKKSLFSKIVGGQLAKIGEKLGRNKEQNINRQLEKDDPGYIRVIDRSIFVFNTITGSETNVEKTYNSHGRLTDYKVAGNALYVSRPIEAAP